MAEQVQANLERMVPYLKDLRNRNLFSSDEIKLIVERRRRSEYLLQRRSQPQMSDYLRYIEDEIQLERLRKLRKEKVLTMLRNEEREKKRRMNMRGGSDDDNDEDAIMKSSYQISGPGDSHILSHIHFLYQRTLKKFHYPLDILLNYAEFSKEVKSFHMLSRVYAMGMQHHPRVAGVWIEAASFEYFGYVAQDYESNKEDSNIHRSRGGEVAGGEVNSKVVGSSIKNARVLMQRGLRINKSSTELWLQYFALELHYVQKLRGRKEILESLENGSGELTMPDDDNLTEKEADDDGNRIVEVGGIDAESEQPKVPTSLLPCQVIYKNAILAIPNDIQFRLRFVEVCRMFPDTSGLEAIIMSSIANDFGTSVEGWVARISYADEQLKNRKVGTKRNEEGFLDRKVDGDDDDESNRRPMKKARVNNEMNESNSDTALDLLQQAMDAVQSPTLYLEGARFLRMRIQRLLEYIKEESNKEESIDDDVSYLITEGEDANGAVQRHISLLDELNESARKKNVSSTTLTLDYVDFLLSIEQYSKAEQLLSTTIASMSDVDASLWLRWAEISRQLERALQSTTPPISILRRALKRTPLHDRHAHILILTELMQQLMMQPSSQKTNEELQSLFQKLILLSQGLSYSLASSSKEEELEDGRSKESERMVNVASTVLVFFNYTILNNPDDENSIRSIYTSLLYHSNYGKSCHGKTQGELLDMKSFFDACIGYEKGKRQYCSNTSGAGAGAVSSNTKKKGWKEEKKARKIILNKLYTAAIGFFSSGVGWRDVVNRFQRDLDDLKCGL